MALKLDFYENSVTAGPVYGTGASDLTRSRTIAESVTGATVMPWLSNKRLAELERFDELWKEAELDSEAEDDPPPSPLAKERARQEVERMVGTLRFGRVELTWHFTFTHKGEVEIIFKDSGGRTVVWVSQNGSEIRRPNIEDQSQGDYFFG